MTDHVSSLDAKQSEVACWEARYVDNDGNTLGWKRIDEQDVAAYRADSYEVRALYTTPQLAPMLTDSMIDAARPLFLALESGETTIQGVRNAISRGGRCDISHLPDWFRKDEGHLTKAGRAIIAWHMMADAITTPAVVTGDDKRNAERYRMIRRHTAPRILANHMHVDVPPIIGNDIESCIDSMCDAAIQRDKYSHA